MAAPDRAPQLAAEGLYVSLGGLPILRDVSLHVDAHEAVAILGGNGSGKTTLIRTLLGLTRFQRGSVTLFGTPVESFKDWARLGYVPQHSSLNVSNATVREIVESGRLAHRRPFQPFHRRDRQQIASALETVGLADRARWPFATLSGGQKQRVLIARALATQPELLVMDEPLAGVDLHSQAGLATLLASLRDSGLALAVVLHEQGPMAGVLDRSITLCDGRVTDAHDHHGATDCDPVPAGSHPVGWSDPFPGGDS